MFIGSINEDLRAILNGMAPRWRGRRVYVGCSGNFTVERILAAAGVEEIHGNDVSLYSCAVGSHLAGRELEVGVKSPPFAWLAPYLSPAPSLIATLLLCSEMFKYVGREEHYHRRMLAAYHSRWEDMHQRTVARVEKALEGVRLASFFAGDVLEFAAAAPTDAVFISFPPTYAGGYEKLYAQIDDIFEWAKPSYQVFDDASFGEFGRLMREKASWMTLRDQEVEDLADFLIGRVQTGMRSKPVFIYAGEGQAKLTVCRQKVEALPCKRLDGPIEGPLALVKLTQGQMNLLRSEYLSASITPCASSIKVGLLAGGKLVGAMGFSRSNYLGNWCDAYMMTDFAVRPTPYPRLSKLVLEAVLSKEMQAVLAQQFGMQVRTVGTTAFTERPVSMKYRGMFELHSRKKDPPRLNYVAPAGQWTLEEGFSQWQRKHGQTTQPRSSA